MKTTPTDIDHIKTIPLSDLPVWVQAKQDRILLSVTLELTARCNNNCVHCYINQPVEDNAAKKKELSFEQITGIIDESVSLGALWFLLSGGEPLLRPDFFDIYLYLKKKGLLVSVFTNASLITQDHIDLFMKYPPRDIEVTVYGVTRKVHAKVTGKNTFAETMAGIDQLFSNPLPVTLKSTVMKSNADEINQIAEFCRSKSKLPFRFDPFLHLRTDRNPEKNKKIISERLSPDEIINIEKNDPLRVEALTRKCREIDRINSLDKNPARLFRCMAGINSCCIDYTGTFKLCSSLCSETCLYDLKKGSLSEAWGTFAAELTQMESEKPEFLETCGICTLHDICSWCPAHADLETGFMDDHTNYFCSVAKKRKTSVKYAN